MQNITPTELINLITKNIVDLIDIREPDEHEIIRINSAKLIPMNELENRLDQIDWSKQVVLFCRTGGRSQFMASKLQAQGKNAKNLIGGIKACREIKDFPGLEILSDQVESYF